MGKKFYGAESYVTNNGHSTGDFIVSRGTKQGDSSSQYLSFCQKPYLYRSEWIQTRAV